jgi:hypothetical protein
LKKREIGHPGKRSATRLPWTRSGVRRNDGGCDFCRSLRFKPKKYSHNLPVALKYLRGFFGGEKFSDIFIKGF